MDKTELEARIKEIEVNIKNIASCAYSDGHEQGWSDGTRNQDEVQYKHGYDAGVKEAEKRLKDPDVYAEGYNKGLEDMWDVWHWYSHASASDVHNLFPEVLKERYTYFVDVVEKIGLAEFVRRIKEDKESDAQILYSTISDLKSDYTKDQIIKALKDNGIEVIEVNK